MSAADTPSPLSSPPFLHFLCGRVAASLAFQIVSVAVGWQIYALSGSALDLGLIGLAQFLPMAALTLVVGHVADRYDRRKIVALCMALEALATLVLAIAALHGVGGKTLIYATIIIMSSARAFEAPTLSTLIPAVVPREWLPRATALSSSGGHRSSGSRYNGQPASRNVLLSASIDFTLISKFTPRPSGASSGAVIQPPSPRISSSMNCAPSRSRKTNPSSSR